MKSLGSHHTLESAIADIVDNCIDAEATRVVVRLLTTNDRLVQVEVVDNGSGMNSKTIDAAMTIGSKREYNPHELGHFGMGLKSASFGHSDVLTVWSAARGRAPVGRRIRRTDYSQNFTCEVLSSDAATEHAEKRSTLFGRKAGTTVVWSELRNTYRGRDADEAGVWLSKRESELRIHLGVTYHRLLSAGQLKLEVLVAELSSADDAFGLQVAPIGPFGYRKSGHPDYPKVLIATADGTRVAMKCHVWPAKSDVTGFRLGQSHGREFQGFFIYRNDRLLQIGGWSNTVEFRPSLQLARIEVEADNSIDRFLTMNPEKSGLKFEPLFHDAINKAKSKDGTTFSDYLLDAENVFKESNKRSRTRSPVIPPAKGFAPTLRKRVKAELDFISHDGMNIKWKRLPKDEFIDVEHPTSTLWLNARYRHLFAPGGGSVNDAPVLKALLFLLTQHAFDGHHLGPRDKDQIALWKSVLGAAVLTEEDMRR
ncbi:UNVERIFIED_ORG: DNA mismatch repair enzyme (predicted ATPase) [Gordonia westfalica J30]